MKLVPKKERTWSEYWEETQCTERLPKPVFNMVDKFVESKSKEVDVPSLDKLKHKGRITEEEYQALCTGDRNDILLAFNLELFGKNDEYVRSILIKKGLEDGE